MKTPCTVENIAFLTALAGHHEECLQPIIEGEEPDDRKWQEYATALSLTAVSHLYHTLLNLSERSTDEAMKGMASDLLATLQPLFVAAFPDTKTVDIYKSKTLYLTVPDNFAAHMLDALYISLLLQSYGATVFKQDKDMTVDKLRNFKKRIRSLQEVFDQLIGRHWQPHIHPEMLEEVTGRLVNMPAIFEELLALKMSDMGSGAKTS